MVGTVAVVLVSLSSMIVVAVRRAPRTVDLTSDSASSHITPMWGDMRQTLGFTEESACHFLTMCSWKGLKGQGDSSRFVVILRRGLPDVDRDEKVELAHRFGVARYREEGDGVYTWQRLMNGINRALWLRPR